MIYKEREVCVTLRFQAAASLKDLVAAIDWKKLFAGVAVTFTDIEISDWGARDLAKHSASNRATMPSVEHLAGDHKGE